MQFEAVEEVRGNSRRLVKWLSRPSRQFVHSIENRSRLPALHFCHFHSFVCALEPSNPNPRPSSTITTTHTHSNGSAKAIIEVGDKGLPDSLLWQLLRSIQADVLSPQSLQLRQRYRHRRQADLLLASHHLTTTFPGMILLPIQHDPENLLRRLVEIVEIVGINRLALRKKGWACLEMVRADKWK